jgi:hypothetical protein
VASPSGKYGGNADFSWVDGLVSASREARTG